MNKINGLRYIFRITAGLTILLLLLLLLRNSASAATITVPDDYAKIQWAIDNATIGNTIEVRSGIYYENVIVNKQLTLRGIGMPVVDANGSGSAITLSADGIVLEGFTVNSHSDGIHLASSKNLLSGNNVISAAQGIVFYASNNNILKDNNVSNSIRGIWLLSSNNNTLIRNNVYSIERYSISLGTSRNNTLIGNNVSNNYDGITLYSSSDNNTLIGNKVIGSRRFGMDLHTSSNNMLSGNNVVSGYCGINLASFSNNLIYNNMFNNTKNVIFVDSSINDWNTTKKLGINIIGGPFIGGNFWAQPDGNGYSQKCLDSDHDGICDLPYELFEINNIDYLPLTYTPVKRISATVEVKPDTLNKASQGGTVTAYIEISGYSIKAIDVSTVKLRTKNGIVSALLTPTEISDNNRNGIPDLMVKFDRQAVIGIVDAGDVVITISGKISGKDFEGTDVIRVIGKK